jgi:EAL domain-containing protein (putative c-di-GMP-specific phosphodiesterase class I)
MRATARRRTEIETGLGAALAGGDMCLHFQPVHTVAGVITGFEALARWPRPGRESIPPAEFIPVAETNGVIAPLTTWALDEGLGALADWRRRRPDLDLTLSVNIAPSQIVTGLQEIVGNALARHRVPPAALCLEITEGALVADNDLTRRLLHKLRDQGVELSIDDFGTGFSSLAYLVDLPVDALKIDSSFIQALPRTRTARVIVSGIIDMARQLDLVVIAEGIETVEQRELLLALGDPLGQGYLFSPPVPAAEAAARIEAAREAQPNLAPIFPARAVRRSPGGGSSGSRDSSYGPEPSERRDRGPHLETRRGTD